MNKIINWFENHSHQNKEKIKTFIISSTLAFGILFIGKVAIQSVFIWSIIFGWFGFNSINVQMNFCLHQTTIIFVFTTLIMAFIIDRLILKEGYPLLSRKIFWIFLLIMILSYVIGHYQTINALGNYEETIFEQVKYLICY